MGFVRLTVCLLALCGTGAALAASAPPPPFKAIFPETNKWAFTCFCAEAECGEQDPIVDYCVAYNARSTRLKSRAVFFALKTMVIGREPKFVVGFGLEGTKGATRAQVLMDNRALELPACADAYCYTPVTAEQFSALAASSKTEGRLYIGFSSLGAGFDATGAQALLQKLITLPQHN